MKKNLLLLSVFAALACGGPRTKLLAESPPAALAPGEPVEVYVGKLDPPYQSVAIVDSESYPYVTDEIRQRQLDQLREKARRLGANTLDEVRILAKDIKGFTVDERVPFTAWRQGEQQLFFMRANALLRDRDEPASIADIEPSEGWAVDRYTVPPRFSSALLVPAAATTQTQAIAPVPLP